MSKLPVGCQQQTSGAPARPVVLVELITTVALALSTLVAATAVSIGFARAEIAGRDISMPGSDTAPFALAWLLGLALGGTGLAAMKAGARKRE